MVRSVSKRAFVKGLQQLVPEVNEDDLVPTDSGVWAQALMPDGKRFSDSDREKFHSRVQRALAGSDGLT